MFEYSSYMRLKFQSKVKHHLPHVYSYLKKLLKVKTICMDDPFSFEKLFLNLYANANRRVVKPLSNYKWKVVWIEKRNYILWKEFGRLCMLVWEGTYVYNTLYELYYAIQDINSKI